ncbi:hypothetical protein D3C84_417870 [compost metagenome]
MLHFQLGHGALQLGQGGEGIAQTRQVARPGVTQADAREDALDIADFLQLRLQGFEAVAIQQAVNGVLARFQYGAVTQRAVQPAAQQAAAHGGLAAVDHRLQGIVAAAGEIDVQLQVAAAGGIEDHGVVDAFMAQAAQVGQGSTLGLLGVTQQAAGGTDGQGQGFAAKALEVLYAELLAQALLRRIAVEVPRRAAAHAPAFLGGQALGPVVRDQQLGRVQAFQFGKESLPALDLLHAEAAAGDVQHRQAEQALVAQHGGQEVVASLVEQCFIADGAGRDDAHHLALHRALAGGRIADLLADHHRLTQLDQLGEVTLHRVEGNAGHGNGLARRLTARGQGDVEQLGSLLGILVEDLVEVAHAIEHQLVRVLVLQPPVLGHHGCVFAEIAHCLALRAKGASVRYPAGPL